MFENTKIEMLNERVTRLEEQLRTAETTLAHAEEFIEHQGMSYRWVEWCEGRNPAQEVPNRILGSDLNCALGQTRADARRASSEAGG